VTLFSFHDALPEGELRAVIVLQAIIVLVSSLALLRLASRHFSSKTLLFSIVVLIYLGVSRFVNGMESAVLLLTLSILLSFTTKVVQIRVMSARSLFWLGLLAGLVVLSRLDMVFLLGVICVLLSPLFGNPPGSWKRVGWFLTGSLVVLLPYLVFNVLFFEHIMPISGSLKSSFPIVSFSSAKTIGDSLGKGDIVSVILAFCYCAWYLIARSKLDQKIGTNLQIGTFVLSMTVLLHFLHTVLFMKWAVFSWHFAMYLFCFWLILLHIVEGTLSLEFFRRNGWVYWLGIAFLLVGSLFWTYLRSEKELRSNFIQMSYDAAIWARENTDESDIFAMKDAGAFGFFSMRRVINLDGVVNSFQFQETLRDKRLNSYLASRSVKYLVQHAVWNRPDVLDHRYTTLSFSYWSHKYDTESDEIHLNSSAEVYRSHSYFDGPHETVFLIWYIGPNSGGAAPRIFPQILQSR
jgi:hypothetical protein